MKRLALVAAVLAVSACAKAENKPDTTTPAMAPAPAPAAAADTGMKMMPDSAAKVDSMKTRQRQEGQRCEGDEEAVSFDRFDRFSRGRDSSSRPFRFPIITPARSSIAPRASSNSHRRAPASRSTHRCRRPARPTTRSRDSDASPAPTTGCSNFDDANRDHLHARLVLIVKARFDGAPRHAVLALDRAQRLELRHLPERR